MWVYILTAIIVLVSVMYIYVSKKMTYWQQKGVAEDPGFFPFGSTCIWDMMRRRISFSEVTDKVYKDFPNERFVGSYAGFGKPILIVRDLELMKRILIKDFDHFVDRLHPKEEIASKDSKNNKYLARMLTNLKADEWKHIRSSLSPVFTSGKLKVMVPLIHKVANECNEYLKNLCGEEINGKELMRDFALDVIVSTAFGIESNTFKEPDNVFKKYSKMMVGETFTIKFAFVLFLFICSPRLLKWFDIAFFEQESTKFFVDLLKTAMREREEEGTRRNDLIDLVIDVIKKEAQETEKKENLDQYDRDAVLTEDTNNEQKRLSNEELEMTLIANSLLTFVVGFDQVSNASSLMLLNLANHPDIQNRLHKELLSAIKDSKSGELGYSDVMKLPYLDMVFHETLRHYPISHLERVTTKDYQIPETNVVIPRGTTVRIATPGIMKDEKYYPNPDQFNPEHFNAENKAKRNPYAYSGFGHGPRNCIAMRFAIMQVKVAVSRILTEYKILPCAKTVETLVPDPSSRSNLPKGGVWFTVEKRI